MMKEFIPKAVILITVITLYFYPLFKRNSVFKEINI